MTLISVLGPTCSGKSDLAVALALEIESKHGLGSVVIISCDSRQVYRELKLGTGKVEGNWSTYKMGLEFEEVFLYRQIPHFLIDFVDLNTQYSLHDYINDYIQLFQRFESANFKPKYIILCGGTGLFAKALAEQYQLEHFKPEFCKDIEALKIELSQYNASQLQQNLAQKIPDFKNILNNSDQHNPRRLINLIIKQVALENDWITSNKLIYPVYKAKFEFYLNPSDLKQRLETRLKLRFRAGLVAETKTLIETAKLSEAKLLELGLEYREFWAYFMGLQTLPEFEQNCVRENWQYVRRQITWFKKQPNLIEIKNLGDILKTLDKDLTKA